jgi:hypothetical protein
MPVAGWNHFRHHGERPAEGRRRRPLGMLLIAPLAFPLAISIVGTALIPLEIFFAICATWVGYIA